MQIEWSSVCLLGGLAGLVTIASHLVSAIWSERWPHLAPLTVASAIVVAASTLLASRPAAVEPLLIAAATTAEPQCPSGARPLEAQLAAGEPPTRVYGDATAAEGCGIWAVIEDPRTGTLWLQGPAAQSGNQWALDLTLGMGDPAHAPLPYRVAIVSVGAEIHQAWLGAALSHMPLTLGGSAIAGGWLASPATLSVLSGQAES